MQILKRWLYGHALERWVLDAELKRWLYVRKRAEPEVPVGSAPVKATKSDILCVRVSLYALTLTLP